MVEIFGDLKKALHSTLRNDRLFDKIPIDDLDLIIKKAHHNADIAIEFVSQKGFVIENLRDFVGNYCDIKFDDRRDVLAYSDIRFKDNVINIYTYHINNVLKENDIELDNADALINLFILHEFYHYLEENAKLELEDYYISTIKIGGFKNKVELSALSEMSAMLFMRKVVVDIDEYLKGLSK